MGLISIWSCLVAVTCLQCALSQDDNENVRRVTIPPLITEEPPKMLAFREGESIEMPCVATGQPDPRYLWQMNGKDFDPSGNDGRIAIQPGVGTLIFSNPIMRDEGIYQCLADNGVGVAVTIKIDLRVGILDPFAPSLPNHHYPSLGTQLTLKCVKPRSFPAPEVFWATVMDQERFTPIDLSARISIDPEGNLHFANVLSQDRQDGRQYVCIVQNKVMRRTQHGNYATVTPTGQVVKRMPPAILWTHPTHQIALLGQTWKIKCIFSGSPTPRVNWERSGLPMPPRKREESFGQELVIENVQFSDAGKYECQGINEETTNPVRRSFDLVIEAAPYWVQKPESVDAADNDTAIFHCLATGIPEPVNFWFINGIPISKVPANPRRVVEKNRIIYYNVTKDDAQVIQCNATNKHGYIFSNAYLNVLSEPPVITDPPAVGMRAAEGQTVNLTCRVFGSPKPVVVWKKSGEQLTGGRFKVTVDGHLQISDVSLVDAGTYTCSATNKFDSVSATGSLVVRRKTLIQMAPIDVMVYEGTEAKFTCTATTDPEEVANLQILWKKDDEIIDYAVAQRMFKNYMDNSLTISGTITLDTGKYTCMATNGLDVDEADAQLVVQGAPDPPTNVKVRCFDQDRRAEIEWHPGKENYAPILNFVIQFNTSFAPDTWIDIIGNLSQNTRRYDVTLSPYGNYTFRVLARNKIGLSMPSVHTPTVCKTQEAAPDKNPENVIGEGDLPNNLVVYWTPMPPIEWNGRDFKYVVCWRRDDVEDDEDCQIIERPDVYHLVIPGVHPTYKPYRIKVKAKNTVGDARVPPQMVIGYSGEDAPMSAPNDVSYDPETLGSTSVLLTWSQVDTHPENVRGYFRGYRIQFWKTADGPDMMREKDLILNVSTPYPRPRVKRQAVGTPIEYLLTNLPPYAEITVQVRVLNKYYAGPPSAELRFTTLEGEPGPPAAFDILARGSTHFDLIWDKPMEPNGILKGYNISYQSITGLNLGRLKYREAIQDPTVTRAKLTGLLPDMEYRVYLSGATRLGKGEQIFLDAKTTPAGPPNPPTFDVIEVDERWIILQWEPSRAGNPGSVFYVQYRPRGAYLWLNGADESLHYRANVSEIDPGTTYQIRVVAKNGEGFEAASEWQEVTTGGIGPGRMKLGISGWFYGIWASLLIIILLLVAFFFCKRKRDVWWEKKEGEIAEAMLQLQAEEAVRQLGIDNQYHMGSREMLQQGDISHASMPGSDFKAPVQDDDDEDDDDDDDDEEEESGSEEEDDGGFLDQSRKSKEAYGGAGYPRQQYNDQDAYNPPEYGNVPVGGQGYHPAYAENQPYPAHQAPGRQPYRLDGQSGQGSSFI